MSSRKKTGWLAARDRTGSVLLLVLFVLALSAALITGMLQLTTEEVLQLRNQIGLARAMAVAEAGLHDAFAQIRQDINWNDGFTDKAFGEDSYTVAVDGSPPELDLIATGHTEGGFQARLKTRIQVNTAPPHSITIRSMRINNQD